MTTTSQDQDHPVSGMSEDLKNDAARLKDSLGTRARQEAETRKGQAAHLAGSASTALETAARDLRDNPEAPDWMATALQSAARRIEGLARHVDGRSVDQLGADIAEFARRSPGTFLVASAAAGFAAARVLRAGVDKKRHAGSEGQGGQTMTEREASPSTFAQAPGWVADENVRPTGNGDFESAYLIREGGPEAGSSSR